VAIDLSQVSTQLFVNLVVVPFAVQVHVQVAQHLAIRECVTDLKCLTGPVCDFQQIVKSLPRILNVCLEHSFLGNPFSRKPTFRLAAIDDSQGFRVRAKRPDYKMLVGFLHSQKAERVVVFSMKEPMKVMRANRHGCLRRKGSILSR
jgi:hypothetical protein